MTTSDARGTPASPLDVSINVNSIRICVPRVISIPYAWAMNSTAKVQYIIEPSRLKE
ncbi:hypothetical protein D3C78_1906400 [compost metagenome]